MAEISAPRAILDTSSLIVIARVGGLADWWAMFGPLGIPPAVQREAVVRGKLLGYDDVVAIEAAITQERVILLALSASQARLATSLRKDTPTLGPGESEAIAFAMETPDCRLVIEDRKARVVARSQGLVYTTAQMCPLNGYIARQIPYQRCVELLGRIGAAMNTDGAVLDSLKSAALALAKERGEANG